MINLRTPIPLKKAIWLEHAMAEHGRALPRGTTLARRYEWLERIDCAFPDADRYKRKRIDAL
jgi:hypothetical protein